VSAGGRRRERLRASLRRAVQDVIARGLQDPRVSGMITVTDVRLTDQLDRAVVSVSVFPAEREDLTLHGLRAAAAHIRREAGRFMHAPRGGRLPALEFKLDRSLKRQAEVLGALAKVKQEGMGGSREKEESSRGVRDEQTKRRRDEVDRASGLQSPASTPPPEQEQAP
jgi:ribosome-binding factor A